MVLDKDTKKKVEHFVYRINETTNPKTQWVTEIFIKGKDYDINMGRLYIDNIVLEDDTLVILYENRTFRLKVDDETVFDIIKTVDY